MKKLTLNHSTTFSVLIVLLLFLSTSAFGARCDRRALTTYMSASEEMQALDASVHRFLKELNRGEDLELLIVAYTAPQYIEHFHQKLTLLSNNQTAITNDLNEFYLCSGLDQGEIDKRFKDTFNKHYQLLEHLQKHDTEFSDTGFSTKIDKYHGQALAVFGDNQSGLLQPLRTTENIFNNLTGKYAQQATLYDFWELKQAKGTKYFMDVTGLNIEHFSPKAQLQEHLDRGLSKDSFLLFGGPREGEEYPQSIYHLARELTGQISKDSLPSVDQLPNRSKLAIVVATSEENEKFLLKLLEQYETAATQFKNRAGKRFHIDQWNITFDPANSAQEILHNWAVGKVQIMVQQGQSIDALLDPKSSPNWSKL